MSHQFLVIRQEYVKLVALKCSSLNKRTQECAAKIIYYFLNWTSWKKKVHRTVWVYQKLKQIYIDFFELHSLHCIRAAIAALIDAGILERRNNPGNLQDKTYQYRVNVAALNVTDGSDDSEVFSESLSSAESEPNNEDSLLNVENSTAENHTDNLIKKSISQILPESETEEKEIRDLDTLKSKIGNFVVTTPKTPHPVSKKQATLPTPVSNQDVIPEDLKNKLEELHIPLDKKVRNAIASHHVSQAWDAANHIDNTWETIDNPRGVFLYRIGKQPIEPIGTRVKEYVASDITLDYLKSMYPNKWKEAATHHGIEW